MWRHNVGSVSPLVVQLRGKRERDEDDLSNLLCNSCKGKGHHKRTFPHKAKKEFCK